MNEKTAELSSAQKRDDRQLIVLCQEGDRIAFERLYRMYSNDVYTMALRITSSMDMAEEVTQETFISVYKDIRKFQFQSAFTTWLYRIVYRRAADLFRKNKKHRDHTVSFSQDWPDNPLFQIKDDKQNPAGRAVVNERNHQIEEMIASLSLKQRTLLTLRYFQNRSYEEIAQILNCRMGTVKSGLNRAHKCLLEKLKHLDIC